MVLERSYKDVVDQFQKVQAHVKNAKEENANKTYDGVKNDYLFNLTNPHLFCTWCLQKSIVFRMLSLKLSLFFSVIAFKEMAASLIYSQGYVDTGYIRK